MNFVLGGRDCLPRGMPRFENQTHLASHGKWAPYLQSVYYKLPDRYPLCLADVDLFDRRLLTKLGLWADFPQESRRRCPRRIGDAYWHANREPPWMLRNGRILPDATKVVPNHTWVEVMRRSRSSQARPAFEAKGMWFGVNVGTGIWFNTGRTIVFTTHGAAFEHFNASWETDMAERAAAAGYDTVQFLHGDGIVSACCQRFGLHASCEGLEFVATKLVGSNVACPDPRSLRSEWEAARPCRCTETVHGSTADASDPHANYLNCQPMETL